MLGARRRQSAAARRAAPGMEPGAEAA